MYKADLLTFRPKKSFLPANRLKRNIGNKQDYSKWVCVRNIIIKYEFFSYF